MIERIAIKENRPFPNNTLPVLYYPHAFKEIIEKENAVDLIQSHFKKNGYTNSWVNGIYAYHHFHATTHEVLACFKGSATVQLGGPGGEVHPFTEGNVLLLPAGVAHKLIEATGDFQIVGAYPNGNSPDMEKGDSKEYEELLHKIQKVPFPECDPVGGRNLGVHEYWK
ncbi:hypothetical protein [Lacticigenium naphthae]|uniref:hypothetical protein n=1 Tax=Lacticigenium naphthae TaxID=515351 RepID=UPI0004034DFF|nr:hypothetical protein [Lacticigenium naphthae]